MTRRGLAYRPQAALTDSAWPGSAEPLLGNGAEPTLGGPRRAAPTVVT